MTRCGFVAIIGRPNVGKSTLVNRMIGEKVSITSSTPNTTRQAIRGIWTDGDTQVVLVDTPGIHKPRTKLGGRLNDAARQAAGDVDVVLAMVDAGATVGAGDRTVLGELVNAARGGAVPIVVVNKIDRASRQATAEQLLSVKDALEEVAEASGALFVAERVEYWPISARSGDGVDALIDELARLMPESPFLFPDDEVTDVPEALYIAELVREQLLRHTREELPHSIHCRVTEYDWPHITVEILVERESQKGMVISKGGQLLKEVGIAVRKQLPEGAYLELRVRVESDWQRREDMLDRFGY